MKNIYVLILNFKGAENTISCLMSLDKLIKPKNAKIKKIVIDNNSRDNSVEKIKRSTSDVEILETGKNLGFTGGNNFGMSYALKNNADYIVVLNNDTRADKNLVNNLFESIDNDEKAAGVLPKIYFERGFEYHKDNYTEKELGRVIWYAGGEIDWANVIGKNIGVDEVDHGQHDMKREIELATGCCFMVKADVLKKIGMFDDDFFLYYEDADLSQRIKKAGFKIMYEPGAILWHKNAESTGGSGSPLQDYFITRNRLIFGMRYAPLRTKIALLRESVKLIISGRQFQKRGVLDYYLKRFGKGSFKI